MSTGPLPGWYPDPDAPDRQRFWDGTTWTEARAYPADLVGADGGREQAPKNDSRGPWLWIAVLALAAAVLFAAAWLLTRDDEEQKPDPVPTVTETVTPAPPTPRPRPTPSRS